MQSGNRQTDLDTGTGTSRSPEPAWASLGCGLERSGPMDYKRVFVSSREIPVLHCKSLDALDKLRVTLTTQPLLPRWLGMIEVVLPWLFLVRWGGGGEGWEGAQLPPLCGTLLEKPISLLQHPGIEVGLPWLRDGELEKEAGKNIWEHY